MTTDALIRFYKEQVNNNITLPRRLSEFDLIVGDPGDTGTKSGLRVLQLDDPGQYGKVHVKGHTITTSNVLSLELQPGVLGAESVTIDGKQLAMTGVSGLLSVTLAKSAGT